MRRFEVGLLSFIGGAVFLAFVFAGLRPATAQAMPQHPAATLLNVNDSSMIWIDLVNVHEIRKGRGQFAVEVYTEPGRDGRTYSYGQLAERWLVDCRKGFIVRANFALRDMQGKEVHYELDARAEPVKADTGTLAAGILGAVCLLKGAA